MQVLQLFVQPFGGANHEVAAVRQRVLEMFGDDKFGLVVEVNHHISEEDAVITGTGRLVYEVVSLVADKFQQCGTDLNKSFCGVSFGWRARAAASRLKIFCLKFLGDSCEKSLFVMSRTRVGEYLFTEIGGIDFDFDASEQIGVFEKADADGEWFLSSAAGCGPDPNSSRVSTSLDTGGDIIQEFCLQPMKLFFSAKEGGFVCCDGIEEEGDFFRAGKSFEQSEVIDVTGELESAEAAADAVAEECDAIFGNMNSAEPVDKPAELRKFVG